MFHVTFDGQRIPAAPGELLLEVLLRAGLPASHGCRSGICQSCRLRVGGREVLACRYPVTADIGVEPFGAAGQPRRVHVLAIEEMAPDIFRLRLDVPPGFDWQAGQYVMLWRGTHACRAYSLASLPGEGFLEVHLRRYAGGALSPWLAAQRPGAVLALSGPFGECVYGETNPDRPLLLAGQGTGLAPLWGILRQALAGGHRGPLHLLHGVRSVHRAYLATELAALAARHGGFRFQVVEGPGEVLAAAALALDAGFSGWKAFLCGAPATVGLLSRRLFLAGMAATDILADPFLSQAPA